MSDTAIEYHFKLEYPFALSGKRKIKPNQDGLWSTTDKALAEEVAKCIGVHTIDATRVAAIEAMRALGQRNTGPPPAPPEAPVESVAPVVSTLDPPSGGEVGDVLDPEEEAALSGEEEVAEASTPPSSQEDELINAEAIGAMTKSELRDLLDEWEISQPSTTASKGKLQEAALAALPPAPEEPEDDTDEDPDDEDDEV